MHGFNCLIFAILVKFSFSHVTFPDVLETAIQNLRSKREEPCGEEIDLEQTGGVAEIQLRTELFNGTEFYRVNEDCTWTLKTAQDHFMILKSDYFSVEMSENCSCDYVEITEKGVDGTTSKYCGRDPLTYITFGSEIQLQFKSDMSFADIGFKFIIESSKRGRDDSKCIGSILGGEDSRIMNKDDLKEDCFYRIQAPGDKVITLELKMLNFGSASCEEESIIIYEGHSTRKPLGTVCGDSVLGILPYHASSMFIEYRNLLQQEGARFTIDYMFVEDNFTPAPVPSTTPSPVGGNNDCSRMYKGIDIGRGIVVYTAPKYESNKDCIVVVHNDIFPKHVVQVEFDYFSIKQSDNCIFDSLRIFSGISNDSGMLGGPYCGESLHGRTFLSPGNSLRLEFKTDVSLALKGFQAKISFVSNTECICNGNKMCIRQDFEKKCVSGQICEGISCQNGGTCIKTGSEETCYCPKGFKGENCSQSEYIRVNGEKSKQIRFTEAPADRTIKRGEGHVEECKVEVPNGEDVEYNWYFKGAMIEPYNKKAGFGTHRGGILQIDVFSDKLAGNYSCFATTSGRTAEHTFEYRIFEECNVRPNQESCDELEGSGIPCNDTGYGCCPDGVTAATGPNEEGCDIFIVDPQPTTDTDVDINVNGSDRTGSDLPVKCHLAKNIGPCKEYTVMWYFNMRENKCDKFWFGGCEGNTNRFKTAEECATACQTAVVVRESRLPVCDQAKEIGPCRAALPRWFYNSRTRACEQFFYGGCQGNDNNFERQEVCEDRCGVVRKRPLTSNEVCAQPQSNGPCRASIPRYYYNAETKRCEEFTYGGCGGNRNNFETESVCRQYCLAEVATTTNTRTDTRTRQPVCELTPDAGPCRRMMTKYAYNMTTMKCGPFTYGGCLGNHNNFETEDKCISYCSIRAGRDRADDCQLSQEAGPCRGNMQRYFYDATQGRCFPFSYGGCQGNRNNFADETTCMEACRDVRVERPVTRYPSRVKPGYCPLAEDGTSSTCQNECSQDYECQDSRKCCKNSCGGGVCNSPLAEEPRPRVVSDVCTLPLQTPCTKRGSGPYCYYEKLSGQCKEVPNGECNNNQNNFNSQSECEAYCSREKVCRPLTYESDIRCLAYMENWTFNTETGVCEIFVYGGCGGSANNFVSEEACNRKCGVVTPVTKAPESSSAGEICAMAEDSGDCLAYIRNWRYESLTGKCVEFTYGGCGGNANNFQSSQECEAFCTRNVVCQKNEDPEIGCLAYIRRWRYEPSTRACENFIYGGCGGNANNFETSEACEGKCVAREPTREDYRENNNRVSSWREICKLQADVGPCKQYIKKWHYNSFSQDCEEFTFGGCLGNHNNFESKDQCKMYCDSSRWYNRERVTTERPDETIEESSGEIPVATGVDVCHMESHTGRCRAYIRAWYYDYLNGECKQFIYGGCDTNGNKFDTQEACEARCSPREICLQPKQVGNCMASMRRFYFDYSAQECKEFVYGGCDGNANSFETKEACERRCDSLVTDRNIPGTGAVKSGDCPARTDKEGLLGACAPTCRDDSNCSGNQKCCYHGCGLRCVDPVGPGVAKSGFCPARTDMQGLLGACAPTCRDHSSCPGNQKCCHHGCGLRCVDPVEYDRRPEDETVVPAIRGLSVTLSCRYGNNVTWYREGKLVESNSRRRVNPDGTIEVFSATIEDDGMYACHVGSSSRPTIYHYMLQVRVPIGILPGPDKIMVRPNRQAFLHCEVYGNPKPAVSWQKSSQSDIRTGGRYEIFSNGTLLIRQASEADIDSYTCTADNGVSTPVQKTIKLELREMLVARIDNDNGRVMEGGRIKLTCEGRGYPTPTVTWEKMGRPIQTGGNVFISSDGQLTIRDVTTRDTGSYSCIVANSEEKIETSTSVQVVPKVMPDDKCEDKTSQMKCRLIVMARLCGITMYPKICCASCRRHFNGE